jgi:hypothetical protein
MLLRIKRNAWSYAVRAPDGARLCRRADGQNYLALPEGTGVPELLLTTSRVLEYARQGVYGLSIRDRVATG